MGLAATADEADGSCNSIPRPTRGTVTDFAAAPSVLDPTRTLVTGVFDAVGTTFVGKREVVELLVVALLAGGHGLLEDVPGTGKTTLLARPTAAPVETVAAASIGRVRAECRATLLRLRSQGIYRAPSRTPTEFLASHVDVVGLGTLTGAYERVRYGDVRE